MLKSLINYSNSFHTNLGVPIIIAVRECNYLHPSAYLCIFIYWCTFTIKYRWYESQGISCHLCPQSCIFSSIEKRNENRKQHVTSSNKLTILFSSRLINFKLVCKKCKKNQSLFLRKTFFVHRIPNSKTYLLENAVCKFDIMKLLRWYKFKWWHIT